MDGFTSQEELYKKMMPALRCKVKDLRRVGVNYVQTADVWNYLKNNLWCKSVNLTLGEMVNDVMSASNIEIEKYVQNLMSTMPRKIEDREEIL